MGSVGGIERIGGHNMGGFEHGKRDVKRPCVPVIPTINAYSPSNPVFIASLFSIYRLAIRYYSHYDSVLNAMRLSSTRIPIQYYSHRPSLHNEEKR